MSYEVRISILICGRSGNGGDRLGSGSLVGNVNGWRGWAIGHGDTVSSPLSRPYLANHLSAVMGPVQLSKLSQELKPAPARGPDQETVRGGLGFGRQSWEGEEDRWPGQGPQGPGCLWTLKTTDVSIRGSFCSLRKCLVLVELGVSRSHRKGN